MYNTPKKYCSTSGKIKYETPDDCETAIMESKFREFNITLAYYKCRYCFSYHLTQQQ